jgi:arylsulfatase A
MSSLHPKTLQNRLIQQVLIMVGFMVMEGLFSGHLKASEKEKDPPNIILIMADDLGAECLESYGGQSYNTPNLNQLAEQGIQFTNAFATPLSTPTRVQLMTGQYPYHNGWTGGIWTLPKDEQSLDPQMFNFGRMLKDAGYATAVAGKWQLTRFENYPGHAENLGFDEHCLWTWQYSGELPDYVSLENPGKPSRFWNPGIWKNGSLMKDVKGQFGPDIYTEFLLDFIEQHQSEPIFVYYPMALPHWPYINVPGMEEDQLSEKEQFTAMVEYMDKLVGKFTHKLKELGIDDNTLLVFTGDNGTDQSKTSRINGRTLQGGKHTLTDAGARVPFLVSWPGITEKDEKVDALIDFSDILPTFADVSGAQIPASHDVDGKSFLPVIKGKKKQTREWVFCQQGEDWFLRTKKYRLYKDGTFEYMENHYTPREVNVQENKEAARVQENLQKAAQSLNVQ